MYAFVSAAGGARVGATAFVSRARCVSPAVRAKAAVARRAAPTMVVNETLATLPLLPLAEMRVTFPAYLAVFLGTLIPVAFLIILFIQSESRKAGEAAGRGDQS
jgi:photosystem II reaction center protein PsbM